MGWALEQEFAHLVPRVRYDPRHREEPRVPLRIPQRIRQYRPHATIRNDRYKLIHRYGGSAELYDLQADPFEGTNLLGRTLTPPQQAAFAALINEIGRLRSPRAAFVPFGSGCTGSISM